jgi:hypothetical protein
MKDYTQQTGQLWPYNQSSSVLFPGAGKSRLPRPDYHNDLATAGRMAGWLHTVARHPGCHTLRRLIAEGVSIHGVNSRRNWLDIGLLMLYHPSPQRLGRKIVAIARRADQILAPYGVKVSWIGLAYALGALRNQSTSCEWYYGNGHRVGKAAKTAARLTLSRWLEKNIVPLHHKGETWFVSDNTFQLARGLKDWRATPKEQQLVAAGWAIVMQGSLRDGAKLTQNFQSIPSRKDNRVLGNMNPMLRNGLTTVHMGSISSHSNGQNITMAPSWIICDDVGTGELEADQSYPVIGYDQTCLTPSGALKRYNEHVSNQLWARLAISRLLEAAGH